MGINPYYLDFIEESKDSPDMRTIFLSKTGPKGHGACIEVHGNNEESTERAIVIINALNEHERSKLVTLNATK